MIGSPFFYQTVWVVLTVLFRGTFYLRVNHFRPIDCLVIICLFIKLIY